MSRLVVTDALDTGRHVREAEAAGRQVRVGFDLPALPWDATELMWCCTGSVETDDDERAAVLAAVRGAAVVVSCAHEARRARLVDDLRRVGDTIVVCGGAQVAHGLTDEQIALLEQLAIGASMAEAARVLLISMRTGERRLAAARKALGVRTTAEAVALLVAGNDAAAVQ